MQLYRLVQPTTCKVIFLKILSCKYSYYAVSSASTKCFEFKQIPNPKWTIEVQYYLFSYDKHIMVDRCILELDYWIGFKRIKFIIFQQKLFQSRMPWNQVLKWIYHMYEHETWSLLFFTNHLFWLMKSNGNWLSCGMHSNSSNVRTVIWFLRFYIMCVVHWSWSASEWHEYSPVRNKNLDSCQNYSTDFRYF